MDAIAVGADTVIADNPALTVRLPDNLCSQDCVRNPRPVILDSRGRVPLNVRLFSDVSTNCRPIVATTDQMDDAHRQQLESKGVEVIVLAQNPSGQGVDPQALLEALGQRAIHSVLLEGGASVHGSFRDAGLIDELWSFLAPALIGGKQAPASFAGIGCDTLDQATRLHDISTETVGEDVLIRGLIKPLHNAREG
jgi:diaminohydroxyphosphoribosylaminopyrimidine deaminase/5-amino-6-(5-phosphoribosylamino)uracil reductase